MTSFLPNESLKTHSIHVSHQKDPWELFQHKLMQMLLAVTENKIEHIKKQFKLDNILQYQDIQTLSLTRIHVCMSQLLNLDKYFFFI